MRARRIIIILFVVLSFVWGVKDWQSLWDRLAGSDTTLTKEVTVEGNIRRVDYVDADGKITFNKDKNFATKIQERDADGHALRENYYDAEGQPAKQYAGHYAVARTWENGRNVLVTYLDINGEPFLNDYGYASQRQSFYENGKTRRVMYLGLSGEPVKDRNGEYGIEYEYDERGWTSRITSLDADGKPMRNTQGWVYVDRAFYSSGELKTVRYYDADGTPAAIRKGVYGTETVGTRQYSLGADGRRVFRINDFLNNDPWIVFAVGAVLALAAAVLFAMGRRLSVAAAGAFLAVYVLFILYETVFTRESGSASYNFELFWSYRTFFTDYQQRVGILDNIWLFVPLGAGLEGLSHCIKRDKKASSAGISALSPSRLFLIPLLFSCGIEAAQLLFGLGLCELDDVFSNTLGGILGIWIAKEIEDRAIMQENRTRGNRAEKNLQEISAEKQADKDPQEISTEKEIKTL